MQGHRNINPPHYGANTGYNEIYNTVLRLSVVDGFITEFVEITAKTIKEIRRVKIVNSDLHDFIKKLVRSNTIKLNLFELVASHDALERVVGAYPSELLNDGHRCRLIILGTIVVSHNRISSNIVKPSQWAGCTGYLEESIVSEADVVLKRMGPGYHFDSAALSGYFKSLAKYYPEIEVLGDPAVLPTYHKVHQ